MLPRRERQESVGRILRKQGPGKRLFWETGEGPPGLGEHTETAAPVGSGEGEGPRELEAEGSQREVSICDDPERGLDMARHT